MSGKFALIIGNTEYIDPGLAQLTAPGRDAEDFARLLKDENICSFDQVHILLNQLSSTVIEAIEEFFDQKKPDDLLVLYFSGHGVRDELGSLYLAVRNTIRTRLRSTAIKSDYIREVMDQSRSKRQVLILDCCNSGAFAQGTKAATGVSIGTATAFEAGYGRIILTASDSTQFAWEGDKVIGETDNSLFTHFLVEGLAGEADLDGDGNITVDELYDYAYDKVKLATPKQTPSKFSSKQQGEIVLRQITRIEDIKPISLPDELMEATEDSRTFVREGAVQQLEKLLKGKNLGLVRSAREALERMEKEDDSRRVSQLATQVLEPIRQAEQKAEEERREREEAERLAALKAEEERLALEKAEAEKKAKEEADRLLAEQKAEEEQRAKEEAEHLAALKAEEERLAREKAETERVAQEEAKRFLAEQKAEEERREREEAERLAALKAEEERLAREKAEAEQKAKEEAEKLLRAQAEREASEREAARLKAEREPAEKTLPAPVETVRSQFASRQRLLTWAIIGITGIFVIAIGAWRILSLGNPSINVSALEKISYENADQIIQLAHWDETSAYTISFSPDGQILASSHEDNIIRLRRISHGALFQPSDKYSGQTMAFSPDGEIFASADTIIHLWRIGDGSLLQTLEGHTDYIYGVAFSPDGQVLASGSRDGTIRLWRIGDGSLLQTLEGHTMTIHSIAFSPDGQALASASEDQTIRLWRVSDGSLLRTLEGYTDYIYGVAFSPDGQTWVSMSEEDDTLHLWRLTNGTLYETLGGYIGAVHGIAFSPDGQVLAALSADGILLLWRVSDGTLLLREDTGSNPYDIAFSTDAKLLATATSTGVSFWGIKP